MKICNKLVRDNVAGILKNQGYQEIKGTKLKGKKYKDELYLLFFTEYKETLDKDNPQQLQVHYADMLEVVRTLMVASKTNIKAAAMSKNQSIDWYKKASPSKEKLMEARIDLLQKFDELLKMRTEAIRDQLVDMLDSFKQLVEAHQISFAQVEQVRRDMYQRLGGYNKGVYLQSVSRVRTSNASYSA